MIFADDNTRIIRRAPLSVRVPLAPAAADPPTADEHHPSPPDRRDARRRPRSRPTGYIPRAKPVTVGGASQNAGRPQGGASRRRWSASCRGWATGVIATDLITGWWGTDLLFCVAVGFLAAVSAAATIGGADRAAAAPPDRAAADRGRRGRGAADLREPVRRGRQAARSRVRDCRCFRWLSMRAGAAAGHRVAGAAWAPRAWTPARGCASA